MNTQTWWDAACNMEPGLWWGNPTVTSERQFRKLLQLTDGDYLALAGLGGGAVGFMLLCFMSEAFDNALD